MRPAQYVSRHLKTFITLMGPMRLERAYYYCPACRRETVRATEPWTCKTPRCHRAPSGWWA